MTQFVLVLDGPSHRPDAEGIVAKSIRDDQFLSSTASALFPGKSIDRVYALVDPKSGQADSLVDAIANSPNGDGVLLRTMNWLAEHHASIALWYGNDFLDLPNTANWTEFRRLFLEGTKNQPPEIYLRIDVPL